MIDTVQAVLLFVIVLLTILFVVLGVQVFFILKDLRETVKRTNLILQDVESLTEGTTNALESVRSVIGGASAVKILAGVLTMFKKRKD